MTSPQVRLQRSRQRGPTTRSRKQSVLRRLRKTEDIVKRMHEFIMESSQPLLPAEMPDRASKLQAMLREYREHESSTTSLQQETEEMMNTTCDQDLALSELHAKLFQTERFAKIGDMLTARAAVYEEWNKYNSTHEATEAQLQDLQTRLSTPADVPTEEVLQIMGEVEKLRMVLRDRKDEAAALSERMLSTQLCIKYSASCQCTSPKARIQELERVCSRLESTAQERLPDALQKLGTYGDCTENADGQKNLLRRKPTWRGSRRGRGGRVFRVTIRKSQQPDDACDAIDIALCIHASKTSSAGSSLTHGASVDAEPLPSPLPKSDAPDDSEETEPKVLCRPAEESTTGDVASPSSDQHNDSASSGVNIGHVNTVAITVTDTSATGSDIRQGSVEEEDDVFGPNVTQNSATSGTAGFPVNIGHADQVAISMTNACARFDWSDTSKQSSEQQKKEKNKIKKIHDDIRRLSQKIEMDQDHRTERDTKLITQIDQLVKDRKKEEEHLRKLTEKECVVIYYLRPEVEDVKALRVSQRALKNEQLASLADELYKQFTIRLLAISEEFVFFLDVPYAQAQNLTTNLPTVLGMIQDILLKDFSQPVAWRPLSVCNPWDIWRLGKQAPKPRQECRQSPDSKDWNRKSTNMQCTMERLEHHLQQEKQQVERKEQQIQALQSNSAESEEQRFTLERLTSLLEKEKEDGASKDCLIQELQATLADMKGMQKHLEKEQDSVAARDNLIQELKARLSEDAALQEQLRKERDEERKQRNEELDKFLQLIKDLNERSAKLEKQLQEAEDSQHSQDTRRQVEEEERKRISDLQSALQKSREENKSLADKNEELTLKLEKMEKSVKSVAERIDGLRDTKGSCWK